jgi:hypothetical protein
MIGENKGSRKLFCQGCGLAEPAGSLFHAGIAQEAVLLFALKDQKVRPG